MINNVILYLLKFGETFSISLLLKVWFIELQQHYLRACWRGRSMRHSRRIELEYTFQQHPLVICMQINIERYCLGFRSSPDVIKYASTATEKDSTSVNNAASVSRSKGSSLKRLTPWSFLFFFFFHNSEINCGRGCLIPLEGISFMFYG